MTPARRVAPLLVPVLAVIAIIFALFQGQRARACAAMLATASRVRDEARAQKRGAEERLHERERAAAEHRKAAAASVAASAAAPRAKETPPPTARSTRALIATNPRLREMALKGTQRLPDYGPKVWVLKMTPEQIAKMKAFNYQIESAKLDVIALAEAQGLPTDHPEIQKMTRALDREMREMIVELLGPEDADRYYAFGADWRLQTLVDQVAGEAYLTDAPVTLAQEQEMVRILRQSTARDKNGGTFVTAVTEGRFDMDVVAAQMTAMGLPPAQTAALRTIVERNQASFEAQQMVDAATARNPAAKSVALNLPNPILPRR